MVTQVIDQVPRVQYTATNLQTIFAYNFQIFVKTDITVEQNGTPLTVDVDFTVSGVGTTTGGNVTLTVGATTADIITVYRSQNFDRETDYQESGDFLSETVNDDMNRMILMDQQVRESISRSLQYAIDDIVGTNSLPVKADRLNKFLGFDVSGNPVALDNLINTTSADTVSSIALLKALSASDGDSVFVTGYYVDSDGGGGHYQFDSASAVADNGGTVIAPDVGSGRWILAVVGGVSLRQFGAKLDGTTDDATAVANAWANSKHVTSDDGVCAIGSTISLGSNGVNFHFDGQSGGGNTLEGMVFKWIGGAGGKMFQMRSVRDSLFENFSITVGDAPSTLAEAIDFDPTGRTTAETNNTFKNVGIVQRGGATTIDNSLAIGFRISRSTSAGNVSEFTFEQVFIAGCSSAGVSIEHSQSRVHTFSDCKMNFCLSGITNTLNSSSGGDAMIYNSGFSNNTTSILLQGKGNTQIFGALSEDNDRFLDMTGSNNSIPINIMGVSMLGTVNADGQVMRFGSASVAGPAGPINIQGCNFGASQATDMLIGMNGSRQKINSIGNSYNNLVPFVQNSGTLVPVTSTGDRGWTGAIFESLPQIFTAVASGDASPDVRDHKYFLVDTGGSTTITTFDNGFTGQEIVFLFQDGGRTIAETDDIKLKAPFISSADAIIEFTFDGTDWQETNRSQNSGLIESVVTTNVILGGETGKTFILNLAAGFVSTLPVPAADLKFKFIVGTAPTGSYTIVTNASANIIHGQITTSEDAAGSVSTVAAADTISFVLNLAIVGDWCEVESDGTNWYVSGMCKVQDGMTTTQVS